MKKIILLAVAAMISLSASAQIYVGGGINLTASSDHTAFSFSPEVGYTINQNWAAGLAMSFASSEGTTAISFSPYARWTFINLGPANLFLDGGLSFKNTSSDHSSVFSFGLGVYPGLAIPLNEHISFVGHLGGIKFMTSGGSNLFNLALSGSDFSVGIYYNF